jgi:hypothetical protein
MGYFIAAVDGKIFTDPSMLILNESSHVLRLITLGLLFFAG